MAEERERWSESGLASWGRWAYSPQIEQAALCLVETKLGGQGEDISREEGLGRVAECFTADSLVDSQYYRGDAQIFRRERRCTTAQRLEEDIKHGGWSGKNGWWVPG